MTGTEKGPSNDLNVPQPQKRNTFFTQKPNSTKLPPLNNPSVRIVQLCRVLKGTQKRVVRGGWLKFFSFGEGRKMGGGEGKKVGGWVSDGRQD